MTPTHRIVGLEGAIGAGLPGLTPRVLVVEDGDLERALGERAVSLLAAAVAAGALSVAEPFAADLVREHEAAMSRCVLLERSLAEVAEILDTARVQFRVLKGPAVAHLDYPDPAWRTFGDLDLLVPSTEYDRAVAALERWGARRRSQEARAGFDRRFGKGVCMIGPGEVQVDLHRMLGPGAFGLAVDAADLFGPGDRLVIAGDTYPTLTRTHRFLHACLHVLGDWPHRLVALRDVAQLRLATDLDLDAALEIADRWRCRQVVAYAIAESAAALDLPADPALDWAAAYRGTRFERRSLGAMVGTDRNYPRQMAVALPAVRGVGAKVSYVSALLLPDRSYLAQRDGSYLQRARRAVRTRTSGGVR
jgi:hypothetical protein